MAVTSGTSRPLRDNTDVSGRRSCGIGSRHVFTVRSLSMTYGFAVLRTPVPYFHRLVGTCLAGWICARLNGGLIFANITNTSKIACIATATQTESSEVRSPSVAGSVHRRAGRGPGRRGGSHRIGRRRTLGGKAATGAVGRGRGAARLHGRNALRRLEFLGRPYRDRLLRRPQGKSLGGALVPP